MYVSLAPSTSATSSQLLRDVRQRGHEEDHVVAEVLPEEEREYDDLAVFGLYPVYLGDAEEGRELVDDAVVAEEHLPDEHDGGHGDHHGAQEEGAELALERYPRLQQHGEPQREDYRQRHRKGRERGRVLGRVPEGRVLEERDEVVQEHELRVYGIAYHGVVHHDAEGQDEEDEDP